MWAHFFQNQKDIGSIIRRVFSEKKKVSGCDFVGAFDAKEHCVAHFWQRIGGKRVSGPNGIAIIIKNLGTYLHRQSF